MSFSADPDNRPDAPREQDTHITAILALFTGVLLLVSIVTLVLIYNQRNRQAAPLSPAKSPTAALTAVRSPTPAAPASPTRGAAATQVTATRGTAVTQAPAAPTATRPPAAATTAPSTPVVAPPGGQTPAPASPAPAPQPPALLTPATVEQQVWYFGEGASVSPFRTWYSIMNPGSQPARVTLTLYPEDGKTVQRSISVRPGAQERILANDILANAVFGAGISSDQPVYVQRLTIGDRDGTAAAGLKPARLWYFPEGETGEDYTAWLVVANPGSKPAALTVTYLIDRPEAQATPVVKKYTAPPTARLTIDGRADVKSDAFGVTVESDQPIVVEESLYFDKQKAAYGGPGLAALSKTWYVASANLQDGFSSRLAVMNPGIAPANVTLTLVTGQTKPVTDSLSIPVAARGRTDIALNEFSGDPQAAVILQSDQPVAMQTVTYYSSGGENDPIAVYSALASASPARQWYLPETTSNDDFDSYVMIFNPGSLANQVAVSYLIDSGETVSKTYDLPGLGQAVLRVLDEVKGKKAAAAAVRGSQPLIAERVIMFRRSVGAAASAGIPAP